MLDSKIIWNIAVIPAMKERGGEESETAQRLRLLREALGDKTQTAFAARVGLDLKRYHNFENGLPLPRDAAIVLVKAIPGLTLDWLHLGREEGLSFRLLSMLREAEGTAEKANTAAR